LIAAALIGATALGTATVVDAQQGGNGMGPGMMGGYGPDAGGGYGPGMMGGYGPGMMSGYGPGTGGGYGPGMMGPGMMGPGMTGGMGYGMLNQLNLTAEQWNKVSQIQQDQTKKHWDLAGKMHEEAFKLQRLMGAEKRDNAALVNQHKKMQEMQTLMFQANLETQDKIEGVLTKEQKAQWRRYAQ